MPITRVVSIALVAVVTLTACSALDVNDPTRLRVENLENGMGTVITVKGVRVSFTQGLEKAVLLTGGMTDEFKWGFTNGMSLDLRNDTDYLDVIRREHNNGNATTDVYSAWQVSYRDATTALPLVRQFSPANVRGARIGEVFALRGNAMLGLAEHICPGFPAVHLEVDGEVVTAHYDSSPQTTDSAFTHALMDFDSALVYGADSARIRHLANVGKARALLGLGRLQEAATAVAAVPVTYVDTVTSSYSIYFGLMFDQYTMSDDEGTNGLNFVSAADPRLPVTDLYGVGGPFLPNKYLTPEFFPLIVFASGIEARLIEAEAQLAAAPNDANGWLATLNTLRTTSTTCTVQTTPCSAPAGTGGVADLPRLVDPGTNAARADLLFRERAFWLFGTAHRLGDLRRLISFYGRGAETVFPTGSPRGTLTSVPFDGEFEHRFNPKITGCTSS